MSEHEHIWQWNGYHNTSRQGQGVLHWGCQICQQHKEEPVVLTDQWCKQAYRIWMYEQKHKGIFDSEKEQ